MADAYAHTADNMAVALSAAPIAFMHFLGSRSSLKGGFNAAIKGMANNVYIDEQGQEREVKEDALEFHYLRHLLLQLH
jgi:hypothetical protein